ncbi:MAG TPA: hypothetical protein VHE81_04925, partial [Lacipirellulaceae bacterium]|nr:hypothetical protein [Lacipirellulaceae bacterium]
YNLTGGAGPGSRYVPEGPGAGGNSDQQETYPRRQVLAHLTGLRVALVKVKSALPTETQAKADAVVKAVETARTVAANKDSGELNLAVAIRAMAKAIQTAVPPPVKSPPEKAAPSSDKPADTPAKAAPANVPKK